MQVRNQKFFRARGRGRFVELGHFDKDFVKNIRKRGPPGKHLGIFSPSFKTMFWIEKFNLMMDTIKVLLWKIRSFFWFSKKAGRPPLIPSSFTARLWVWLNTHHYPWVCLTILENAWINCSDWALKMHDHPTCSTGFWRCLGF